MRDSRGGGRSYPMGGGGGPSGRYPMSDYDEPPYGRGGPMMSGPPFNGGGGGFPPSVAYRGPPAPPYRGEIYDAQGNYSEFCIKPNLTTVLPPSK